jgi:hypothetical protein
MNRWGLNRRWFLQWLAAGMLMGVNGMTGASAVAKRIRAAALQMAPKLDAEARIAEEMPAF